MIATTPHHLSHYETSYLIDLLHGIWKAFKNVAPPIAFLAQLRSL